MMSRSISNRNVAVLFWILAAVALLVWMSLPSFYGGWDLQVYAKAMQSVRAGHDPYLDGIAVQQTFHEHLAMHPQVSPPFTYVYSPITLPLLRGFARMPIRVVGTLYLFFYAAGFLAALWVGMQLVEAGERRIFALLAPAAVFFPGLLQSDNLFSGNIAYLLYGLILFTALIGWRRERWIWFYMAALVASCFKAPLLSVLAIPIFSARRQGAGAGLTAIAGVALFLVQPLIWPSTFHNYLTAVDLQFLYNRDFSSSPAGVLADVLFDVVPYRITSAVFYLFYASLVVILLLRLRRRFLAGEFSAQQWIPVMLLGVLLLNPRIMEYDVHWITLPMALIVGRIARKMPERRYAIVAICVVLLVMNVVASRDLPVWKVTECFVLVTLFLAGSWNLFRAGFSKEDGRWVASQNSQAISKLYRFNDEV